MYLDSETSFRMKYIECHCLLGKFRIKFSRLTVFRVLMFGSILFGIFVGFMLWLTGEMRSSTVVLRNQSEMSRWLSEQFARRETIISFRYEGDTKSLTEKIGQALSVALYSDPFIRYNVGRYAYKWKGDTNSVTVNVHIDYRETFEQSQYVKQQAKEITNLITHLGQSPHIKVKAIYDYIINNVAYDESMTKFTAYEALTEGRTICQGYALLMQAMLEAIHVPSKIVEGTAGGQMHAWNLVQLDGRWYHIDVTWDDPPLDRKQRVRYTYYMRTDAEIQLNHQWEESVKLPKATTPYEQVLERIRQGDDKNMQSFVKLLEGSWSPDVLLLERQVTDVKGLVERVQTSQKMKRKQLQVRYHGNELELYSNLQDMMNRLGLFGLLEYQVSSLNGNDDLLVQIQL